MSTLTPPIQWTPEEVERVSKRDGKRYELIDGELKEKDVGTEALFVASRICERIHSAFYPHTGFAVVEPMVYCFGKPNHGRKPDVAYVRFDRLPNRAVPRGDLYLAPDLVVEVLSPGNSASEIQEKLDEYLEAGVSLVWIVSPERRTIRIYRSDGTTQLFRGNSVIENEPLLPGFRLIVDSVFPAAAVSP